MCGNGDGNGNGNGNGDGNGKRCEAHAGPHTCSDVHPFTTATIRRMSNLYLVGFMGAGKSAAGRVLAGMMLPRRLGRAAPNDAEA